MTITCTEAYDSPKASADSHETHLILRVDPPTLSSRIPLDQAYLKACEWIADNKPFVGAIPGRTSQGILSPNEIRIEPKTGSPHFDVYVTYTKRKRPSKLPMEYTFDTTGETAHITQSLETVSAVSCRTQIWDNSGGGTATKLATPRFTLIRKKDSPDKTITGETPFDDITVSIGFVKYATGYTVQISTDSAFTSPQTFTYTKPGNQTFTCTNINPSYFRCKATGAGYTDSDWMELGTENYIPVPDFGGGIGYTDEGFDGCDVKRPGYQWSETHYFPFSFYTLAYRNLLINMSKTVNSLAFRGFDAGQVFFEGGKGGLVTDLNDETGHVDLYWKITYDFIAGPNVYLNVGASERFQKRAWDYFWVLRRKTVSTDNDGNACTLQAPHAAYVERVYPYVNFGLLLIPDQILFPVESD